jgi:hypothetical protein
MTTPRDLSAALYWQAFRYVADEMTSDELDAFEAQLDGDQQAREMVSEVVELSQALHAAPAVSLATTNVPANWVSRTGWMSLGAAACLALIAAWNSSTHTLRPSGAASDPVAMAWTEYRHESSAEAEPQPTDEPADIEEEQETPGWLLAAVIQQQSQPSAPTEAKQ